MQVFDQVFTITESLGFLRNGIPYPTPYDDKNGIDVFVQGSYIVLNAGFGLSIRWNGIILQVLLCNEYAGYVCGLCGNADGIITYNNEFVDRRNVPVAISEDERTAFHGFGNKWRTSAYEESSRDIDGSSCNDDSRKGMLPTYRPCSTAQYEEIDSMCSMISNTSGPWAECLAVDFIFS